MHRRAVTPIRPPADSSRYGCAFGESLRVFERRPRHAYSRVAGAPPLRAFRPALSAIRFRHFVFCGRRHRSSSFRPRRTVEWRTLSSVYASAWATRTPPTSFDMKVGGNPPVGIRAYVIDPDASDGYGAMICRPGAGAQPTTWKASGSSSLDAARSRTSDGWTHCQLQVPPTSDAGSTASVYLEIESASGAVCRGDGQWSSALVVRKVILSAVTQH